MEWLLAKVRVDDLAGRLQTHGGVELGREVAKRDAEMMAVLRVKACIVD